MTQPCSVRDLIDALDTLAPSGSAQPWDNVGLQVGDPDASVERVVVALDCTMEVIDEALRLDAQAIVTHHPLLFKPLRSIQPGGGPEGIAFRLATSGLALVAAHTNFDAARAGVSFALAGMLGLRDVSFLRPARESRAVLVTFVPPDHLDPVRNALAEAGAGQIGAYSECAFTSSGTGMFRPDTSASPYTKTPAGVLERANEVRLEMELSRWDVPRVVRALQTAHPYEQPAYHLLDALQADPNTGLGAIGTLEAPVKAQSFLQLICDTLGTPAVRATYFDGMISRVAVCGGSGSDFVRDALRARADAYVTADVTYHKFFDVLGADGRAQLLYVDVGHFESERHAESLLLDGLARLLPVLDLHRTTIRTSASDVFVAHRADGASRHRGFTELG